MLAVFNALRLLPVLLVKSNVFGTEGNEAVTESDEYLVGSKLIWIRDDSRIPSK